MHFEGKQHYIFFFASLFNGVRGGGGGEGLSVKCLNELSHHMKFLANVVLDGMSRALDKREHLMIIRDDFCSFCIKAYIVTLHLNRLVETVQMRVTTYVLNEK